MVIDAHRDQLFVNAAINAVCRLGTEFTRFLSRGRETSRIRWPDPRADRMVEEVRRLMIGLEEEGVGE